MNAVVLPVPLALHAFTVTHGSTPTAGDKNSDPLHPNNDPDQPKMKRDLNLFDLLMLGVAAIIGAGVRRTVPAGSRPLPP